MNYENPAIAILACKKTEKWSHLNGLPSYENFQECNQGKNRHYCLAGVSLGFDESAVQLGICVPYGCEESHFHEMFQYYCSLPTCDEVPHSSMEAACMVTQSLFCDPRYRTTYREGSFKMQCVTSTSIQPIQPPTPLAKPFIIKRHFQYVFYKQLEGVLSCGNGLGLFLGQSSAKEKMRNEYSGMIGDLGDYIGCNRNAAKLDAMSCIVSYNIKSIGKLVTGGFCQRKSCDASRYYAMMSYICLPEVECNSFMTILNPVYCQALKLFICKDLTIAEIAVARARGRRLEEERGLMEAEDVFRYLETQEGMRTLREREYEFLHTQRRLVAEEEVALIEEGMGRRVLVGEEEEGTRNQIAEGLADNRAREGEMRQMRRAAESLLGFLQGFGAGDEEEVLKHFAILRNRGREGVQLTEEDQIKAAQIIQSMGEPDENAQPISDVYKMWKPTDLEIDTVRDAKNPKVIYECRVDKSLIESRDLSEGSQSFVNGEKGEVTEANIFIIEDFDWSSTEISIVSVVVSILLFPFVLYYVLKKIKKYRRHKNPKEETTSVASSDYTPHLNRLFQEQHQAFPLSPCPCDISPSSAILSGAAEERKKKTNESSGETPVTVQASSQTKSLVLHNDLDPPVSLSPSLSSISSAPLPPPPSNPSSLLKAFDLRANFHELFQLRDSNHTRFHIIDAIKVFFMIWILIAHAYLIAFTSTNFRNYQIVDEFNRSYLGQFLLSAAYGVDGFYFLSAFLFSYITAQKFHPRAPTLSPPTTATAPNPETPSPSPAPCVTRPRYNPIRLIFLRYLRITPLLLVTVLFSMYIFPKLSSGPLWHMSNRFINEGGLTVFERYNDRKDGFTPTAHQGCQKLWYTNLLYVNNFSGTSMHNSCLSWTWYLAGDYQYYLVAVALLWLVSRGWRKTFFVTAALLSGGATLMTLKMIINNTVSASLMSMVDPGYLERFYRNPIVRLPVSLYGVVFGIMLQKNYEGVRDWIGRKKRLMSFVTILALCGMITLTVCRRVLMDGDDKWSRTTHVIYMMFDKLAFAVFLSVFFLGVQFRGHRFLHEFLSWKLFQPLGKLTYPMYLVHCLVLLYYFLSLNYQLSFSFYSFFAVCLFAFVFSLLCSILLVLFVEMPVSNLIKWYFQSKKTKRTSKSNSKDIVTAGFPLKEEVAAAA